MLRKVVQNAKLDSEVALNFNNCRIIYKQMEELGVVVGHDFQSELTFPRNYNFHNHIKNIKNNNNGPTKLELHLVFVGSLNSFLIFFTRYV